MRPYAYPETEGRPAQGVDSQDPVLRLEKWLSFLKAELLRCQTQTESKLVTHMVRDAEHDLECARRQTELTGLEPLSA